MFKVFVYFSFIFYALATCPSGNTEWRDNCFIFVPNLTQFAGAELACNQLDPVGHLASIPNGFTNAILTSSESFQHSTVTDFWIGANTLSIPNVWSWTDGSSFNFTEWAAGEPQNLTGQSCAALSIDHGSWSAQDCFKLKPYVCSVPKVIPPTSPPAYVKCPVRWIYYQPTHSCFGLSPIGTTGQCGENFRDWTSAEEQCRNFSAYLPSFHSQDEFEVLQTFIYYIWQCVWTGIRSDDGGLSWKNADDTLPNFLPWGGNYPTPMNNSCVSACTGAIFNTDCNGKWPFVCKKSAY